MAVSINRDSATQVLLEAFNSRCSQEDLISKLIKAVIDGTHKTYKYILVNGLLAKATNEYIDPIALQAKAPLKGAYDARSLCHKVLVPFERDFLHKALGGSNEPFLNKPARFTHLSSENAVRAGRDAETLGFVIEVLQSLKSSEEAKAYLACALNFLNDKIEELQRLHESSINYNPTLVEIFGFIYKFLEKSFEGETSVIVVGTLEKIFHRKSRDSFRVLVHKVNQSGSSSKEVGDIDIFKETEFQYAIEVKDKDFNNYDLEHAMTKILENGAAKGQFVYGTRAAFQKKSIVESISKFEQNGFMILFKPILDYSKFMLFKIDLNDKQEFADTLMETAIEINCKTETKEWIQFLLNMLNWK